MHAPFPSSLGGKMWQNAKDSQLGYTPLVALVFLSTKLQTLASCSYLSWESSPRTSDYDRLAQNLWMSLCRTSVEYGDRGTTSSCTQHWWPLLLSPNRSQDRAERSCFLNDKKYMTPDWAQDDPHRPCRPVSSYESHMTCISI